MKRFAVSFSTEAIAHVEQIHRWWETYRTAAPRLFREELAAAIEQLCTFPESGVEYPGSPQARRVFLARTRYYLYYVLDASSETIQVQAVWHVGRGKGPRL